MSCNETIDVTGAVIQPLQVDYNNTLPFSFALTDEDDVTIPLTGTSLTLKIYRDQNYAEMKSFDGVIAPDELSVSFSEYIDLPVNNYWYCIVWTNNDGIFTVIKGPLTVV